MKIIFQKKIKIIFLIFSIIMLLVGGYWMGRLCACYTSNCGMVKMVQIMGMCMFSFLVIIGFWIFIKVIKYIKQKKYFFLFLLVYSLLVLAFGILDNHITKTKILKEIENRDEKNLVYFPSIDFNTINLTILFIVSIIFIGYSLTMLYKEYFSSSKNKI